MVSRDWSSFEDLEVDGSLTLRGIIDIIGSNEVRGVSEVSTFTGSTVMGFIC